MAWNQPGGNGSKDPWGGRNDQQGPPDLDEVLRKLQARLSSIFGGGRQPPGGGGIGKLTSGGASGKGIIVVLAILFVGWVIAGIYIVEPAEEGVVLRFGEYNVTTGPGPHWAPYLVDEVSRVNVEQIRRAEIGFRSDSGGGSIANEALMLTRDENIVDINFVVLYRIKDSKNYLFNVLDPDTTLRAATESAIREITGKSSMDFVLTEGRSEVASDVEVLTQEILDRYQAGLLVTSVNMQGAQPPPEVQDAFSDAVKAREDEIRTKNEARAYAADILPKARGDANAIIEQGVAYKERVVKNAEGETDRFLKVLEQYAKAPEVTRQRMYLDAVESVMSGSTKVLVDVDGGNNLLYLPLDKMVSPGGLSGSGGSAPARPRIDTDRIRQSIGEADSRRRDLRGRSR
ncbi:MAG: FtsH protease activity modulator HflK [Pseudomonadota bacterium]